MSERKDLALVPFKQAIQAALPLFETLLPATMDVPRFARIAMGFFNGKMGPALAKCTTESFIGALLKIAELNLEPVLGMAYLVPFKDEVTLIIGYQGKIELAYRSERVKSMSAVVVRKGDEFEVEYGTSPRISHRKTAPKAAPLTHVYATADLTTGGTVFVVLDAEDVAKRRAVAKTHTVWNAWTEEQWLKTAIHALFKIVPKSAQMQMAANLEEASLAAAVPVRRQQGVVIPSTSTPLPWEHSDEPEPAPDTDGAFDEPEG